MVELTKNKILHTITHSEKLKNQLTFLEQLRLYNKVSKLTEEEIKAPVKSNRDIENIIKMGLSVASLRYPIPGLALTINYIVDFNRYKCISRIEKSNTPDKNLGYAHCRYRAVASSVKIIQQEVGKCGRTEDPKKCNKKLFKLLMTQRQKLAKADAKLRWALDKSRHKVG